MRREGCEVISLSRSRQRGYPCLCNYSRVPDRFSIIAHELDPGKTVWFKTTSVQPQDVPGPTLLCAREGGFQATRKQPVYATGLENESTEFPNVQKPIAIPKILPYAYLVITNFVVWITDISSNSIVAYCSLHIPCTHSVYSILHEPDKYDFSIRFDMTFSFIFIRAW